MAVVCLARRDSSTKRATVGGKAACSNAELVSARRVTDASSKIATCFDFRIACFTPFTGGPAESSSDPPSTTATVTIGSATGNSVSSTFAGFSYEKSVLSEPLFTAGNTALVNLFKMLGPGILRVGGNTVNETAWSATGAGLTAAVTAPPDIDRLAGFLRATGWKVIYGLNGTTSKATLSAREAAYVARSLGNRLYGFEIGNEPDLYHSNGLKPKTYTFADFLIEWESYRAEIDKAAPHTAMTGPAVAFDYNGYTVPFAANEAGRISLLTEHYYRGDGRSATSTIDLLLSPDPNLPSILTALKEAASTNHITRGYRMAEANSFYHGGAPGISDAFGSALWALEFCFTLAENGAAGVNFHGGWEGPGYSPIAADDNGRVVEVRPVFYGMLLFSMAAHGSLLTTQIKGTATALLSYAVAETDGSLAVVLANNSRTEAVGVNLSLPQGQTSATALSLTSPSLDSTSGVTFGGSEITSQGLWKPTQIYDVPMRASSISIDVPASTVILVQAKPKYRPGHGRQR